ncbi:amidase [Staphylococcus aureus]|nr:amidase [Staphylococcus aureus]PZH00978.1 amidase [Staphylococcus aureus]
MRCSDCNISMLLRYMYRAKGKKDINCRISVRLLGHLTGYIVHSYYIHLIIT